MPHAALSVACAALLLFMQTPSKQIIMTKPAPVGPYSPAIKAGGFIYVSGTLAQDANGEMVGKGDIAAQTRQVAQRIREVLESSGSSLAQVVAVTVYLKSAGDFAAMNDVYKTFWAENPPTRTTVISDLLLPDALGAMSMIPGPTAAARALSQTQGWRE